ncbi:EAL domain-containing protein [Phormidium tenue FACHB-886]|nr:EAL domain-containing protein [Phormidium tenue FACHB-886]
MDRDINSNNFLAQLHSADILIVDDVLENVRLLSKMLAAHGYQTRKATNGKMALTAIEATLPSLILLDIRMPEMNGYQVCQQIKSDPKTASIPVIFLSAADEVADKVEGFRVGGADYITKPFHVEEVLARVQNQLTIVTAQQTICELNAQLERRIKERTQQLEAANSQLSKMAFHDPLTRLPNRALLMQRLQAAVDQQQANPEDRFAVFYLDCDRFKTVNDSFGHQVGDELLIAVSERLKSVLRQEDLLVRLGGDEFVILLEELAEPATATQTAEQILNSFAFPFHLKERDVFVSFSIGIVLECLTYHDPELLLRDADTAMYQAKALGKDQYRVFTPAMYQATDHRLQLETDLRKSVQNKELALYYQPIVELATGAVVGAEALIRWHHPTYGLIPPDQFIPIAEETGFILKLGRWVLIEACCQLRRWQQQQIVNSSFSISVNISACQFAQPDFVQQIDEILAKTQVDSQCLKLEITETVIMQNLVSSAKVFHSLHQRSIQLSIDDFGTGYSSLSYLHSFPIDNLKIDRSFVQSLHKKGNALGLVTAIVQIAETLGMFLIAEGIETNEQLAQLKLLGCHFGQGYLFSKPLLLEEMSNFLSTTVQKNQLA